MTDRIELTIKSVGSRGDGIAEGTNGPVYVPFTAPGDVVEAELIPARKGIASAKIIRILQEGAGRGTPPCQHFTQCGGCSLQHLSDQAYRDWLKDRTRSALSHQGFADVPVAEVFVSLPAARRRMSLKAMRLAKSVALGFHAGASHQIIDLKECPVARESLTALFEPLRDLLQQLLRNKAGVGIVLTESDSGIDLVFETAFSLGLRERERLTDFANKHDIAAMTWIERGYSEPVIIRRQPVMNFGGAIVPLPPGAFIQATAESEQAILKIVRDAVGDARHIADLFCGLGTFTLPLARNAKLLAAEGLRPLVQALQKGINQATDKNLKEIRIDHRDLFRNPLSASELKDFDAVLFDPPRAGAKEQVKELAASDVPLVIGISCNPNSFSRDARILVEGGYSLSAVHPIGQFLWSSHIELVGIFIK